MWTVDDVWQYDIEVEEKALLGKITANLTIKVPQDHPIREMGHEAYTWMLGKTLADVLALPIVSIRDGEVRLSYSARFNRAWVTEAEAKRELHRQATIAIERFSRITPQWIGRLRRAYRTMTATLAVAGR